MKWSNHAETRSPFGLTERDVAEGYIAHAVRVLAGEAKLGDSLAERRETIAKAQRIMAALGQGKPGPVAGPDRGLAVLARVQA